MSEQSGETKEVENKKDSAKRLGRNIVEMKYDKNEDCPVCLREMKNTTVQHTLCGHTFHSSCLEQQFTSEFNNNNKCALCRKALCIKEITDEKKTDSTRPPSPSDENERGFNEYFINTYSDLTDMFRDTYEFNAAMILLIDSITDDEYDGAKERMRELKEDISNCSICLIKHLQSANDIHVQGTNDIQGSQVVANDSQVEEKDVDIETLLMIVENTNVSVLNAIGQAIPLISNTCSLIGLEELEHYIKKNHEYKEHFQNKMNLDIERIKREREERLAVEHEDEAIESEDEAIESEDEASESEDEASESEDEAIESEDEEEKREKVEREKREKEEREMEEKEIKERETDFNNLNDSGYYTADGNVFDGEFNDGKFTGYCHYTFANGNVYQGECKDGKFNGGGKKKFANGNVYKGDYKDGLMDGRGTFNWVNGGEYEGEYKNGKKHGHGRLFIPNGFSFQDFTS